MAPHKALIYANQMLPDETLLYLDKDMYKPKQSLQVFMLYSEETKTGITDF